MKIAAAGHYPDKRNKKGIELEGVEVATFGDTQYIFVASERASMIGVYKDTGAEPEFVQLLPSGVGPEGLVAIPSRNLLVTANETDLVRGRRRPLACHALRARRRPGRLPDDHLGR